MDEVSKPVPGENSFFSCLEWILVGAAELGIEFESQTLLIHPIAESLSAYCMLCKECRESGTIKPFLPDAYSRENPEDIDVVMKARIRPKRRLKLLMAMGFSRNEARRMIAERRAGKEA